MGKNSSSFYDYGDAGFSQEFGFLPFFLSAGTFGLLLDHKVATDSIPF
jgi:hypothetical protein